MKNQIFLLISVIIFLSSCSKDELNSSPSEKDVEVISPPSLNTGEITNIKTTEAVFHGETVSDGNTPISERGFCWSTVSNPDLNDNKVKAGSGLGTFSQKITNLASGTKYYVKAFATNSAGTTFGEEKEFTTSSKPGIFSADKIWDQALQNSKDKLLYIFIQNQPNQTTPSPVIIKAYNYADKEVSAEKEIGSYYLSGVNSMPLHSIGMYNGQMELYILENNTVTILDAVTLDEITNFEIPGVEKLTSIRQENNLLFIGVYGFDKKLLVYSRETMMKISESLYGMSSRAITSYFDSATNNIYCFSFPQFSNSRLMIVDRFDSSGNLISSKLPTRYGDNTFLRVNSNSNALVTGVWGNIYYKSDVLSGSSDDTRILSSGVFIDYRFSLDDNTLYTLQDNSIGLYNTSDYTKYKSIGIDDFAQYIFTDNDDIMVIHYNKYSTTDKDLYLSIHE